jgi:outer membrane lipoprotein SlyB
MNRNKIAVAAALFAAAAMSGCATSPLTPTHFSGRANLSAETVQTGIVVKTFPIKIRHNSQVQQNAGIGAAGGGIAGYLLGGGAISAIAGALGGGVIGDAVTPGSVPGTDVLVKLTTGQMLSVPEAGKPTVTAGEQVAVISSNTGHYRVEPLNVTPAGKNTVRWTNAQHHPLQQAVKP